MTRAPVVARADEYRHYDWFVREHRTFWGALVRGREGGYASPAQKKGIREGAVVDEECYLAGTPGEDPVPESARKSGDASEHRIRCCAGEDGEYEAVTVDELADGRGVAQALIVKVGEAGGSHSLRSRVLTSGW